MSDCARFGPAGVPPMFRMMGAKLIDVPKLLKEEDLNAFEYAAVRWGQVPQIKREDAEKFGVEAKKNDIRVSVHASYFINLFGEVQVAQASKQRLIACATAAKWMDAEVVVFHPGFYGKNSKAETLQKAINTLKDTIKNLKELGIEKVKMGPETMGRHSQFGTLDEVLTLCQEVEQTQLVIDWSHLHARTGGALRTAQDFREIVTKAESKLGTDAVKNMHCHFSKIEYTYKSGEKRHHSLDEPAYGPEFQNLATIIAEFNLHPTIICETPLQDIDAMKMRNTLRKTIEKESSSSKVN
jgi:deoxyribonuclease-4